MIEVGDLLAGLGPEESAQSTTNSPAHGSIKLAQICYRLGLVQKKHYAKKFSVTSNLRYMHGVLNVDEIKN
jgi:hypothetical protein